MNRPHVLLVDDDPTLLKLLGQFLEQSGYEVSTANSGKAGLGALYEKRPDLVVVDVMMPGMDGWQLVELIRGMAELPIILLTAKGEEGDKLKGFRLGADDYVTKPFSFAELAARIGAVLNRTGQTGGKRQRSCYQIDDLIVDIDSHHVSRGGQEIRLTPTEFQLLQCFVENAGRVLSPGYILERVWGPEYTNSAGYVRRYVWYLRQKIEPDPANPKFILTEREFGYRFRKI